MPQRKYRDPVHNIIALDSNRASDRLLIALIDTPEFQRLRRIKQLGLALYTYQGAEHSRFTHSLGVMHIMTRVLEMLQQENTIDPQIALTARVAALLHDVGHGPFSHVIEKVTAIKHETWTAHIITDTNTAINAVLKQYQPDFPTAIIDIYQHKYPAPFASQLVSSQLDCDRCDYLLRDSLMTGAKYGNYDLEWIIHSLKLDATQKLYVSYKGLYAVEQYLQARFYMFRQVYFHHSLRAAENMLIAIVRRVGKLSIHSNLAISASPLIKLLTGQQITTSEFLALDDYDLMFHLKQWMTATDNILSDLCRRFINRQLFKSIDVNWQLVDETRFISAAEEIITQGGFDPEYYLLRDSAGDTPYLGPYSPAAAPPKSRIYIESARSPQAPLREITEVSTVIRGLHSFRIDRLCFPQEVSPAMYQLLDDWHN
jgi:HD superfamily phosphohydrolase